MSGPEFFQTGLGRKFYESDVPRIARSLERIATVLELFAASNEDTRAMALRILRKEED